MAVSTFLHIGVYYPTVNLKRNYFTLQICESGRNFGHPHPPQSLQPKGSLIDPLDHWWDAKFSRREGHAISTKSTKM